MGNEKKEYAIGEVFRNTGGKVYQCVEGAEDCMRCAFGSGEYRCAEICCGPRSRTDGRSVIFTEVTKPVEGTLYRAGNGRMYRLTKGNHWDKQCACDDDSSLSCYDIDYAVFKNNFLDWHWAPIEEDTPVPVDPPKPPESPKRHIELSVVRVEGDTVKFRIAEQTHRCDEFSRQDYPREFKAANGFMLRSAANPEWRSVDSTLYCRGNRNDRDNIELTCTAVEFSRICDAIYEYNSTDGRGYEKPWAKKGDKYFYITVEGEVECFTFRDTHYEHKMRVFGNLFRTEAEAEAALERVKQED